MSVITLDLPYPPSVNHYWIRNRRTRRLLISEKGRSYRELVGLLVYQAGKPRISGPVRVEIVAHPPDRRVRDLDNLCKALLDALEHANVFENDHFVRRLELEWGSVDSPGRTLVTVARYDGAR